MAYIIVQTGAEKGAQFPLRVAVVKVGRSPDNHIVLPDSAVSRFHAELCEREGQWFVRDLGSTHGTYVNDARIEGEQPLKDNDVIRLGQAAQIVYNSTPLEAAESAGLSEKPQELVALDRSGDQAIVGVGDRTTSVTFAVPADRASAQRALLPHQLEVLSRAADAMQSLLDLDQLLGEIMDIVFEIFQPDRGIMLLQDEHDGPFVPRVCRPPEAHPRISQTVINQAVQERRSLLIADTASDARFSTAKSIIAQAIQSALCSPLVSKDRVLGVLYIDSKSRPISYQKEDVTLLNILAANAAVSIENAVLIKQKVEAERLAAVGTAVAGISHYVKNLLRSRAEITLTVDESSSVAMWSRCKRSVHVISARHLTGVIGSASVIEMALEKDDISSVKQIWPLLQRSTGAISSLVQDMLTYSKKREPEWQEGNLNEVLREIQENQAERAVQKEVQLTLECDPSLPDSQFDPKGIHDTLLNIVGNAIEACEERSGAHVSLRTDYIRDFDQVRVSVADNGPGIRLDIQKKIFEPFFSTKGSRGTGLGLAVARKTVEEHRGTLLLNSEPGKGATFKVILPRLSPAAQVATQDSQ